MFIRRRHPRAASREPGDYGAKILQQWRRKGDQPELVRKTLTVKFEDENGHRLTLEFTPEDLGILRWWVRTLEQLQDGSLEYNLNKGR